MRRVLISSRDERRILAFREMQEDVLELDVYIERAVTVEGVWLLEGDLCRRDLMQQSLLHSGGPHVA